MSSPSPAAPPGWYPDPFGRLAFRWWDGTRWTGYAGGTAVEWDPAPLEPPPVETPGLPGLATALLGAVVGAALSLGIALGLEALDRSGGRSTQLGLSQLGLWVPLVLACVVVSRRRGTGSLSRDFAWRFRWRDIGLGFAGSLVGRMMAGVVIAPIPSPFFKLRAPDRTIFDDAAGGWVAWAVVIGVACIGAPLVEELFFRGLLQSRLVTRYGVGRGLAITTVLFGAAHLAAWQGPVTLLYGLSIAGAGLVLGVMRQTSGSLGPPTMAHVFFNAQAVLAAALLR